MNVVTVAKVVRGHIIKVADQGFLCAGRGLAQVERE